MAIAAPAVSPSKVVTFKNWAVGCDNGLACEAVSLAPQSGIESFITLAIVRKAGLNDLPSIELSGFATQSDRYRIFVDKRVVDTGVIISGGGAIAISGADATKVAQAIARGINLRLVDGDGQDLGKVSLAGATVAFRYIDTAQGRAGSRGAIVAKGRKKSAVKEAVVPVIAARRIVPSQLLPDAAALVALSESSPCAAERFGATEDSAYSLGPTQALVLLNCGSGAYNFSVGAYVGNLDGQGKWTFVPATFDYNQNVLNEKTKLALLVNADWDSPTQTISSYAKGRGLGDCGNSHEYVWDGTMFRLIRATFMEECRGSTDWITVWRADVSLNG